MKRLLLPAALCILILIGCGGKDPSEVGSYITTTAEKAKTMMDEQKGYILLDVRTQEEFDEGHIEGAILIPDTEIRDRAGTELPDKDATILIYCRSGRRSKLAAQDLVDLGYTHVYEFGGILNWPYAVVQ